MFVFVCGWLLLSLLVLFVVVFSRLFVVVRCLLLMMFVCFDVGGLSFGCVIARSVLCVVCCLFGGVSCSLFVFVCGMLLFVVMCVMCCCCGIVCCCVLFVCFYFCVCCLLVVVCGLLDVVDWLLFVLM